MSGAPGQRVAGDALRQLGTTALGMGGGVVLSILLARALGPREMGSYALALMVVTAVQTVAGLGLERTALKFTAELTAGPAARAMRWLLIRRSLLAVGATLALGAAAPLLGSLFHDPLLAPLLLIGTSLLLPGMVEEVLESGLEGASRFDLLARATLWLTPIHLLATGGALALGGGVANVMVAQAGATLASVGILAGLSSRAGILAWRPGPVPAPLAKRMGRFAGHAYWLSLLSFVVRDRIEVLLLGALSTSEDIGFYSVALGAAEAAMRLGPWIVATVFYPLLVADCARAGWAGAAPRYAQCLRYLSFTAAPLALGGIAVAEAGVAVVFGPAYAPMVPLLRISLLSAGAAAMAQGPTGMIAAAERQEWLLRVRTPLAVANVLLNLALIPRFGALGAASANLAVAVSEALLLSLLAGRLGRTAPPLSLLAPLLAATLAAAVAGLALGGRTDAVALVRSVLLAVPVYFGALAAGRFFRPEDAVLARPVLQLVARVAKGAPTPAPSPTRHDTLS